MQLLKKLWLAPILLLAACSAGNNSENYGSTDTTAVTATAMPSDVATENQNTETATVNPAAPLNSPERKIARTADVRCEVKNTLQATMRLEQLTKQLGGATLESSLQRTNSNISTTPYKSDSLRETKTSITTATMTLRVPANNLDSLLQTLPGIATTVNTRTVKQQDLTYSFVANELRNNAFEQARQKGMTPLPKRSEALETQQYKDAKTNELIDRKISNLQILDNVAYATITIALTEPETINQRAIPNPEYYTETPLLLRLQNAFTNGWSLIAELILGVITLWPMLFLVWAGWYLYKKIGAYRTKSIQNR